MTDNKIYPEFISEITLCVFHKLSESKWINKFVLVEGTALSLQLKHRLSEYLDFIYQGDKIPTNSIKSNINKYFHDFRIIRQDGNWQLDVILEGVKVTFFSSSAVLVNFNLKERAIAYKKMLIASYETIAVLKMGTIAQRNTIRDYYDIYYIARYHIPLTDIFQKTKKLLPNLSPITYTETLIYIKDIEEESISEHLNPKEAVTKDHIARFFEKELKKIF